jgi:hypothetical protein
MVILAGVPGLEPRLTEPESVVLPITPYPTRSPFPGPHATKILLMGVAAVTCLGQRNPTALVPRHLYFPVAVRPRRVGLVTP